MIAVVVVGWDGQKAISQWFMAGRSIIYLTDRAASKQTTRDSNVITPTPLGSQEGYIWKK